MTFVRNGANSLISVIFLTCVPLIHADLQDFMNLQHRRTHLPNTKFGYGEYSEYSENEDSQRGSQTQWDRIPSRNAKPLNLNPIPTEGPNDISDTLDPNLTWDSGWMSGLKMGQLSAVTLDPEGNIAIFSRGDRVWGMGTFDNQNKFDCSYGPIKQNTIILVDKSGREILKWGRNMFYLPHGLTIDSEGNYWVTDVALHQVLKFNAKDIEKNWDLLKKSENEPDIGLVDIHNHESRFDRSVIKPSMVLGEAFQPGDDNRRFCKPTAVAVAKNGDFFVSDGYCNSRVIKFNSDGNQILQWGRSWSASDNINKSPPSYALFVPHAVALSEDEHFIYVADREDGRIMCYNAQNGSFHRQYKYSVIGTKIYSVAYARDKIYLVNGPDVYARTKFHVRGFVIDVKSGDIVSQFGPGRNDMIGPHDIAVSEDGNEIYVVELNEDKIYRFSRGNRTNSLSKTNSTWSGDTTGTTHSRHESASFTNDVTSKLSTEGPRTASLVLSIVISALILIGICLTIAVIVARCQKRGCLLSVRRRAYWEAERRENFKLSSLLDPRQGKSSFKLLEKRPNTRDFSKLNTEPETSEDEPVEDSLII